MASSYSRYFSHGAFSLLNRASIVGFGFLNVMCMVRIIPRAEIGTWVLFTSVTAILEMMRAGFIRNPFITHLVSAKDEERPATTTASLTLHILLSLVLSLIMLVSAGPLATFWRAPGLQHLLFLYSLQNLLLIPYFHFEYIQTATFKFSATFFCNLIRQGVPSAFIMMSFALQRPTSLVEISMVQIIAVVLGTVAAYPTIRGFAPLQFKVNAKLCRDLFHFGKFTFGTNISSMVIRSTDNWMLGRLTSPAIVALYNPAVKLANIFEVPTLAISNFIFPRVSQKMKERGKAGVRDTYIKSVSLMLAFTLPMVVPLFLFSDFFIVTLFGEAYRDAANILEVTAFYSLIIPFNRQFGTMMDALKKPRLNFYSLVIVSGINVVFNYVFFKWLGVIGCAYATLTSFTLLFLWNQTVLYKHFGIRTLKVIEHIFTWYATGWNLLTARFAKAIP